MSKDRSIQTTIAKKHIAMSIRTTAGKVFLNQSIRIGHHEDSVPGTGLTFDIFNVPFSGRREMPINYGNKKIHGKYRSGGAWLSKWETVKYDASIHNTEWLSRFSYKGMFYPFSPIGDPWNPWLWDPGVDQVILQDLFGYGAGAVAGMQPAEPAFSAASSLYELREIPGLINQARKGVIEACEDYLRRRFSDRRAHLSSHSKTAQWHLAIQFGWMPVLSDIRNFIRAQKERDKVLRQVIRDENRPVRRQRDLRKETTEITSYTQHHGTSYNPHMLPALNVYAYASSGDATTTVDFHIDDHMWAVAEFQYILPPGPRNGPWTRNMIRRIMGGRITPLAIWNVLPWSWLIDYFIDIGSFIKGIGNGIADLLVTNYCYVMRHYECISRVSCTQVLAGVNGKPEEVFSTRTYSAGFKSRVPGSLFGFRLKTDLSVRQLGILGALGFSALP